MVQSPLVQTTPNIAWQPLPVDFVLPDDPVGKHPTATPSGCPHRCPLVQPKGFTHKMLIASNMALVATVNEKIVVKAPDWFYVPRVQPLAKGMISVAVTPLIYRERLSQW